MALLFALPAQGQLSRDMSLRDVPLRAAVDSLMKWYSVSIIYLDRDVDGRLVDASCAGCTFENALGLVLRRTELSWVRSGDQYLLRRVQGEAAIARGTVAGSVKDSLTEEPLSGAYVRLIRLSAPDSGVSIRTGRTNASGFFSLQRVPAGIYDLVLTSVGYDQVRMRCTAVTGNAEGWEVRMVPVDIAMAEITVEGYRSSPAAERNVAHGIYLRSTPADYNYYYLDGARLYNPAHYGGVATTIDEEMLNDVRASAGGISPAYGGQMGGVIDLSLRSGSTRRTGGTASIGSLGTSLSVEGPLVERSSFLVTARRGFPEPVIPTLASSAVRNNLGTTELSAKLFYRVASSGQISFNGFYSRDSYASRATGGGFDLPHSMEWENRVLNARWISVVGPSLFLRAGASLSGYESSMSHGPALPAGQAQSLSSEFSLVDLRVYAHVEDYVDDSHTLLGGAEVVRHRLDGYVSPFATQTGQYSANRSTAWESSFYLQDEWCLTQGVSARLGARVSTYTGTGGNFSTIDPRFSLLVELTGASRLYGSLTTMNEFLHPYRSSGAFAIMPGIFWYAPTDTLRPMTSQQGTIGGEFDFDDERLQVSADAFYRMITNLHEFVVDSTSPPTSSLAQLAHEGTGTAYGFRASVRRRAGRLSGTLAYTLSWVKEELPGQGGSRLIRRPLDRRHEVQISMAYAPDDHWSFGLLGVVASFDSREQQGALEANHANTDFKAGAFSATLPDLNSDRLPGFQRLEVQCAFQDMMAGLPVRISLRLLNGYGILDPFTWTLTGQSDIRRQWLARLTASDLFPLYPALDVSVRL